MPAVGAGTFGVMNEPVEVSATVLKALVATTRS